jgi:hypothetical protein
MRTESHRSTCFAGDAPAIVLYAFDLLMLWGKDVRFESGVSGFVKSTVENTLSDLTSFQGSR